MKIQTSGLDLKKNGHFGQFFLKRDDEFKSAIVIDETYSKTLVAFAKMQIRL